MPLTPGQRRIYRGEYNRINQEGQPDGSVIVTIDRGRFQHGYRMHIRDLWGENEEVLSEEITHSPVPGYMQARLAQAAKGPP